MTEPAKIPESPLLAVCATFTAEPIEETLVFWNRELGLNLAVRFAPSNQAFQQLLDPSSLLASNRNGVNVLLVRLEDWARHSEGSEAEALEATIRSFDSALRAAAGRFSSPLLVAACPASPAFLSDPCHAAGAASFEAVLETAARDLGPVHLLGLAELDQLYPVAERHDPHGEELGHVPYTPEFFTALGTLIARKVHALRRAPYKVIVLDCDETLWRGVCGEDGPQGIVCDAAARALQEFMLRQHEAGRLLCLCSKNNEEDVVETFRSNPEMPLELEHFAARRLNWEPKSGNLVALAEELNLGLDSFIFVDDNRAECAEVEANTPEVLTIALPQESQDTRRFLEHVWAFDRLKPTREDRDRAAWYLQEVERARLEKQAPTLEQFLTALNLQVRISPAEPGQLARAAQLTHRTNQLNLTTIRRSELDLRDALRSGMECLVTDVADRFGRYGLVGVMLYTARGAALAVDTFLLSCRALGKGIEHRMLARLGEIAVERGLATVSVPFVPTARNRPALDLLRSAGAQFEAATDRGLVFRFPAPYAAAVTYVPVKAKPTTVRTAAPSMKPAATADYLRIATELREVERIRERIVAARRRRAVPATVGRSGGSDGVPTDLERRLAAIWARLLGLPAVGIHDNFFDLGGHSLLAVQLLSRVRQEFGVDVSLEVVYSGPFTVAELAKAVEILEIEQAGAEQYAELYRELEGLSDEEVRALLAREEGNPG